MAETLSDVVTITAPELIGVWMHDPTLPDTTSRNFIYAEGRTEKVEVEAESVAVIGRRRPVIEFGDSETLTITLTIFVPYGPEAVEAVDWWRAAQRARRPLFYRDGRSRAEDVAIKSALSIADGRAGTAISVTLDGIDREAGL